MVMPPLPELLALAQNALPAFGLPLDTKATLISLSENAMLRLDVPDGRRYALRIHREGYHGQAAIESELAWLTALRTSGNVHTPEVIMGRNHQHLKRVRSAKVPEGRHAVLFSWENGTEPKSTDDLRPLFETLGEVAAKLHTQSRRWTKPAGFTRHTWDFDTSLGITPHWGRWQDALGMTSEKKIIFARTVAAIENQLKAYGKSHDRFGLVHGDLRLANLLIDGDTVKVIDFDDCGFSWFMYDAATPVSFFEHEPQVPELIEHWKIGYRRIHSISAEDEAIIPTLVMLRRLLLMAWIGNRRDAEIGQRLGAQYTEDSVELCERYLIKSAT